MLHDSFEILVRFNVSGGNNDSLAVFGNDLWRPGPLQCGEAQKIWAVPRTQEDHSMLRDNI